MHKYNTVAKQVEPKRKLLAEKQVNGQAERCNAPNINALTERSLSQPNTAHYLRYVDLNVVPAPYGAVVFPSVESMRSIVVYKLFCVRCCSTYVFYFEVAGCFRAHTQESHLHQSIHQTFVTLKSSNRQIELDVTMAELAQAQSILKETLAKVAALEAQFDEANTKKVMKKYIGAK